VANPDTMVLSFLWEIAGSAIQTAIFLWAAHSLWTFFMTSDDGSMDKATEAYLQAKNTVSVYDPFQYSHGEVIS